VRLLVRVGVDVDAISQAGTTRLMCGLTQGVAATVALLLKAGAVEDGR
jgi:hypothetical protein